MIGYYGPAPKEPPTPTPLPPRPRSVVGTTLKVCFTVFILFPLIVAAFIMLASLGL